MADTQVAGTLPIVLPIEAIDMERPVSIKEILAQLDGIFPMDEAVVEAAEPVEEFDDRNRLCNLKSNLNYSAGHPGSIMRQSAYNNMCYLCEKYAPIDGIDRYDPQKDPSVTGARIVVHEGLI